MCGRVFSKSSARQLVSAFAADRAAEREGGDGGDDIDDIGPTYNGPPGRDYPLIIAELDMPGRVFVLARWGLIPRWMRDPKGGPKPINARAEAVASNGMFRAAYRSRRALMPVDGFFEWKAVKGEKAKQPYAIAMADGSPFALAAIYEYWRDPASGLEVKTFAIVTCRANALMAEIHDRMPVVVAPEDYERWLGSEADPRDLLKPYPPELMIMWPIATRVNKPVNDDPSILDPLEHN
ncbi:SOS response-associated peptidase [Kaustia mangrovi]|uniref:Abasic site processing protein n=1 Tax=Kaustia mangrovi TaxID=2593653 RepID=A0A7S8HDB0_9HYPH|nr:SOS response-associated peptidase [Kaustia mangrovi]QPC44622.1 SOS response-associated peptidase [Kaustia mangrovi]